MRKTYLAELQSRQKWVKPAKNVQEGDVVVIAEDGSHRGAWRIGRVTETKSSGDNRVRSVTLEVGDASLDSKGKRTKPLTKLSRPVQKLVPLVNVT